MKNQILSSILAVASVVSVTGHCEEWRDSGDPSIFYSDYEKNFFAMPLEARLPDEHMPWSEVYWRSQYGGIAGRWYKAEDNIPKEVKEALLDRNKDVRFEAAMKHAPYYRGYFDRGGLLKLEQLRKMSIEELKHLSPTEKFDIYLGNYTKNNFYPWTQQVLANNAVDSDEWFGICQGWTGAAISYDEPAPVLVTNKDGLVIPFGSSDVKGLMAQMFADEGFGPNTSQLSRRCFGRKSKDCLDVNPGALHVVMTNQIAVKQRSFAGDADNGVEVWNQPYTGYKVEILDSNAKMYKNAAANTARVVKVRTVLEYASDDVSSQWEPMLTRKPGVKDNPMAFNYVGNENYEDPSYDGQAFSYQVMEYYLDLDSNNRIIGGEWLRAYVPDNRYVEKPNFRWVKFDRRNPGKTSMMFPDFLWLARGTFKPQGDWKVLMTEIYKASHAK